jgi:uncharacterized protein (DUF2267 family)
MTTIVERLFGATLVRTEAWMADLLKELGTEDAELAMRALRSTLHLLRDRLPVGEALDLAAQLPMLLRGLYFEGWQPTRTPVKRSRDEFLAEVKRAAMSADDPVPLVRAVLRVLTRHVSRGEIDQVRKLLPRSFEMFWQPQAGV